MTRSEFIQTMFLQLYPIFIDELLEDYDEDAGEKAPKLSEVYLQAFNNASKAAEEAADLLQSGQYNIDEFWTKS